MNYILEILTTLFFTICLCFASSYYSVNRLVDMFVSIEEVNSLSQERNSEQDEELEGLRAVTENKLFQLFLQSVNIFQSFISNVTRVLFLFFNVGTVLVI